MENRNVRKITDGAMMCAIIGVLLLIDRQLAGWLTNTFLFVVPLPMVFYSVKYGIKDSWVVLIAIVLLSMILGTPEMIFLVTSSAFVGVLYGNGIKTKKDPKKLVLLTMLVGVVCNLITGLIFAKFFGYSPLKEIGEAETMMNGVLEGTFGFNPFGTNFHTVMIAIFITVIVLTGVLQGYLTHIFSRLMLKRFKVDMEPMKPIGLYYPPVYTGYVGMACFIGVFYLIRYPLENANYELALVTICLFGCLYLMAYGLVFLMLILAMRQGQRKALNVFLVLMCAMMFPHINAIMGFLYITTGMHRKLLEKGGYYATKNE